MAETDDIVASLRKWAPLIVKWAAAPTAGQVMVNAATALTDRDAQIERLTRERDESRQIVRDIYWMALRYADGRYTYAVSMVNDAVGKAYAGGWLEHKHQVDPAFARDGDGPEWQSIEARATTAERDLAEARAEVERKDAALRRADQFITNGIELGFIRMPGASTPDPAHETPSIIRAALTAKGEPG